MSEQWTETDGFGIARVVAQAGSKRRYSYDYGMSWRATARKARQAAGVPEPWYWLDGVPYCPACVEGAAPCMGDNEAARAVRGNPSEADCRCHSCGERS